VGGGGISSEDDSTEWRQQARWSAAARRRRVAAREASARRQQRRQALTAIIPIIRTCRVRIPSGGGKPNNLDNLYIIRIPPNLPMISDTSTRAVMAPKPSILTPALTSANSPCHKHYLTLAIIIHSESSEIGSEIKRQ